MECSSCPPAPILYPRGNQMPGQAAWARDFDHDSHQGDQLCPWHLQAPTPVCPDGHVALSPTQSWAGWGWGRNMEEPLPLWFRFPPRKGVTPLPPQPEELPPVSSEYREGRGTLPSNPPTPRTYLAHLFN